jgi:hypothetical protein
MSQHASEERSMAGAEWYIFAGGREQGPFTNDQIRAFVDQGKLKPTMGLRREGMAKPVAAANVQGLFPSAGQPAGRPSTVAVQRAQQAPPPPPPQPQPQYVQEPEYLDEDQDDLAGETIAYGAEIPEQPYEEEPYEDEPAPPPPPRRRSAAGRSHRGRGATETEDVDEAPPARRSRRGAGASAGTGSGGRSARGGGGRSRRGPGPSRPVKKGGNGLAITSMVLGILALVTVFVFWIIAPILAILGVIFGFIARAKNKSGMALAGIITSLISLVLVILLIVLIVVVFASFFSAGSQAAYDFNQEFQRGIEEMESNGFEAPAQIDPPPPAQPEIIEIDPPPDAPTEDLPGLP